MNKRGFTTIELITSFSVAITILIILFNVVLLIKDYYQDINTKTRLLVNKDNLSYAINSKLKDNTLKSLTTCADTSNCFLFTYNDNTSDKLIYDIDNSIITFNNYTFEITDDITVSNISIKEDYTLSSSTIYNGYFVINIPITSNNKDYSIRIMHQFNTENLMITI